MVAPDGAPANFPAAGWNCPPVEYRPAVLWSWNGSVTRARITAMLEGFASRGIGGVFIHPRPGLVTEYLSPEWFDLWGFALAEGRRLGVLVHVYDENSFPSGFAGGHVVANNPLTANSRLAARWLAGPAPASPPADPPLAVLARDPSSGDLHPVPPGTLPAAPADRPRLALHLEKFPASLWHAGFPMTDVCRTDTVEGFLDSTHRRYAALYQAGMGRDIRYVFTDEPETGSGPDGYHLSRHFLAEFHLEHGYALEDRLAELCGEQTGSFAVRHDYHATLNRLFTSRLGRLVHDWCGRHDLRLTGHLNEHGWPFPIGTPSTMAFQRWMHCPGLDLLGFQFRPGPLPEAARWLFNVKEATSTARQCGREEVLCESGGGGGYGYGPAEMKPLEDFLLALGVNRLAPHLSHQTLAGVRKYDWPQTISDHAPWWDAYHTHARHIARVAFLLAQGTESNRALVLNPTTTGWMRYRPEAYHWPDEDPHAPLAALAASYPAFLAGLYARQIDFDLGDECLLAELGAVESGRLRVGRQYYDTVVIPDGMENMLSTTVSLLALFVAAGGTVLAAGRLPSHVDGRPRDDGAAGSEGWIPAGDGVADLLRERHPPRLGTPDGSALPADLLWSHRALAEGGSVVFLANPTTAAIRADVAVTGAAAYRCDTTGGAVELLEVSAGGHDRITLPAELPPGGHLLFWVDAKPPRTHPAARPWVRVPVQFSGETPHEPNVLPLDYCEIEGPGRHRLSGHTTHADTANWRAQGFEQNLWRVSIQYRRTFVEARLPEDSGFTVRYRFTASPAFAGSPAARDLVVAVERPWLAEIRCNDRVVTQANATPWFDEEMRLLPLGGLVRAGTNVIALQFRRFDVLAEIMPLILRGRFRAVPHHPGFRLEPDETWPAGAERSALGWGFYPGRSTGSFTFELPAPASLRVRLPGFRGSAMGVCLDGSAPLWAYQPEATLGWPRVLEAGAHRLDLVLCGHLKNLLGPHFDHGLPGAWSWENSPCEPPPGSAYRLLPVASGGEPVLTAMFHA